MSERLSERLIGAAAGTYLTLALGVYALPFILSGAFFASLLYKILTMAP